MISLGELGRNATFLRRSKLNRARILFAPSRRAEYLLSRMSSRYFRKYVFN